MRKGWITQTLDEACLVEYGTRVVRKKDGGRVYPVYGGGGETFRMDIFNRENRVVVSRFGVSDQCVRYVSERFFLNDSGLTVATRDAQKLNQRFLDYQLFALNDSIYKLCRGTAQKNLDVDAFRRMHLTIPKMISEQQRIVAILDEAFAGLATATANTQTNLENARELFASKLSKVFSTSSASDKVRRLVDIVTRLTNGYVGPIRSIYVGTGVPYLLARHVRNNRLEFDGKTFISNDFNERHKKSKLKIGDVLLVQSGHIGHSAVVGPEHEGHNCHAMIVISPIADQISGDYLSLYFGSSVMKRKFDEIRSGSTVPHLTCGLIRELMIPTPAVMEQQALVSELKEFEQASDRLASLADAKLTVLDQLKRSLLQKAFSGELSLTSSQVIREAAE